MVRQSQYGTKSRRKGQNEKKNTARKKACSTREERRGVGEKSLEAQAVKQESAEDTNRENRKPGG